jgi:hypothetical protein
MSSVTNSLHLLSNWNAFQAGGAWKGAHEFPLYTDVRFTGDSRTFGPCTITNSLACAARSGEALVKPALVLRADFYQPADSGEPSGVTVLQGKVKTRTDAFHAGTLRDEVAALLSLNYGIRLSAGPSIREFIKQKDSPGIPRFLLGLDPPTYRFSFERPMLHTATGCRAIEDLNLLDGLVRVPPAMLNNLIRSARMYQQAMWMAESEPSMAWLLLISSVECAANAWWNGKKPSHVERFRDAAPPELVRLIEKSCSSADVEAISTHLVNAFGARKKFVGFVSQFLPPAPVNRPAEILRIDWDIHQLEQPLKRLYDHRSKALHSGVPFPSPLCEPPWPEADSYLETPPGDGTAELGGVWKKLDLPTYMHIFEHIARGALKNWWLSLIRSNQGRPGWQI